MSAQGEPIRVLLIEDSDADAALILRELRRGGYALSALRVQTAEELRTSLSPGREWDIVLADYSLPSLSGDTALSLLAGDPASPPLIVVSGTISDEVAVAAMRAGARLRNEGRSAPAAAGSSTRAGRSPAAA